MLQVPPSGLHPSRPALKAPQQDPAEAGFPAMAILAAAQAPPQPTPPPSKETPSGPESGPKEASLSQPVRDPEKTVEGDAGGVKEQSAASQSAPGPVPDPMALGNPAVGPAVIEIGAPLFQGLPLPLAAAPSSEPPVPTPVSGISPAAVAEGLGPESGPQPAPSIETGKPAPFRMAQDLLKPVPALLEIDDQTAAAPLQEQIPKSAPPLNLLPKGESLRNPTVVAGTFLENQAATATTLTSLASMVPKAFGGGKIADPSPQPDRILGKQSFVTEPEPIPVDRPAPREQLPSTSTSDPVLVTSQAWSSGGPRPAAGIQSQVGMDLTARLASPVAPGKIAEGDSASKSNPKVANPGRSSEEPRPRPPEAPVASSEATTGPAIQEPKDLAPALPRTESLGVQPTQPQTAIASGNPVNIGASKPPAPIWQAPMPSMLHQVENGIRWMLRNASPGAELQLHPEALGRIRIELKVEGGEVHARLWASDPKSIPVLQENKAFLEVSLKEQGLNLGSYDLRQHSNQPQPQYPDGQSRGQFWPTEALLADRRQDAPSSPLSIGLKARGIELIA